MIWTPKTYKSVHFPNISSDYRKFNLKIPPKVLLHEHDQYNSKEKSEKDYNW